MRLADFEDIDWDDPDTDEGNFAHCQQADHLGFNPDRVVAEVLAEQPVEIKFATQTAEFAVVGPDHARNRLWVVLFDASFKRGDWLRPITGWPAEAAEIRQWEKRCGRL